jgi:hypothetical protein
VVVPSATAIRTIAKASAMSAAPSSMPGTTWQWMSEKGGIETVRGPFQPSIRRISQPIAEVKAKISIISAMETWITLRPDCLTEVCGVSAEDGGEGFAKAAAQQTMEKRLGARHGGRAGFAARAKIGNFHAAEKVSEDFFRGQLAAGIIDACDRGTAQNGIDFLRAARVTPPGLS